MNVDDAFRKLMGQGEFGKVPSLSGVMAEIAGGEDSAMQAPAADVAVMAEPEPVAKSAVLPWHTATPLDLSRIKQVETFEYQQVNRRSQIAEEYRKLRTRINAIQMDYPSILLTSCHHNEGKTSTALNLSMSMARQRNRKICLVDLDLRRPRVRRFLRYKRQDADILSVLRGEADPEDAMLYSKADDLYVLAPNKEESRGTELLEMASTRALFDRLHKTFDFVVVDSSPCTSTSDPAILGHYVGGMVMVVRCLHTQRESIQHAITSLGEVGIPTIGVILSFVRFFLPKPLYRYQYYHGYYYYQSDGYGEDGQRRPQEVPMADEYENDYSDNDEPSIV